ATFDRVKHALVELFALFAILIGRDRLATNTMLDPGGTQQLDSVPADLDGNHGVGELLDHDAHPMGDADVAVQPPGPLPGALPADPHEDQCHRVSHQLTAGPGREFLEEKAPDVAVNLP